MDNKSLCRQLLVFLLLWVGFFLLCSVFQAILNNIVDPHNINVILIEQAISSILIFGAPIFILIKLFRYPTKDFLQLDFSGKKVVMAVEAAIVSFSMLPIVELMARWNNGLHFGGSLQGLESNLRSISDASEVIMSRLLIVSGFGHMVTNLLVVAFIPAVVEELFFRCGLQQLMSRCVKNSHIAIITTAAIFSIAHGDVFGLLPRFVLGLILGYLFYYCKSLLVNVTLHFVNNAIVVVVCYLYGDGIMSGDLSQPIGFSLYTTIVSTIVAIVLIFEIIIGARKSKKIQ